MVNLSIRLENEYKESTEAARLEEQAQRELERQSNFYEKLERGFDVKILVVGNSMGLSEESSSNGEWIDIGRLKIR